MAIRANYPDILPTLNLDFANTKKLDPRITFTRTTTATYYDGKTTAKAEENLALQSQAFDTASWTKNNVTATADTVAAPDGTTTADTITASAITAAHTVTSTSIGATTSTVTGSAYLKAGTNNFAQIFFGGSATPYVNFDLSLGTYTAYGSGTTGSITSVGNGWYRCVATTTVTGLISIQIGLITALTDARALSWTAAGTETIYVWGAQLEQRSSVTAYTPTTTALITNYIPVIQTAAAGQARFDHSPTTGESLGLLIEEARTNLLLRSAEFDNASWTKSGASITANAIVAPDGTLSADQIVEDTTNAAHIVYQNFTLTAQNYTLSVYAKPNGRNWIYLYADGGLKTAFINISTATVGTTVGSPTVSTTSVGNGWYRVQMSFVGTITTSQNIQIRTASADGTTSYTGDGYSGVFLWGAQLEANSFATSYIPTTSATVTRNADDASMTGTNFSSWFRTDEGTINLELILNGNDTNTNHRAIFISNNSTSNYIGFDEATNYRFLVNVTGSLQANLTLTVSSVAQSNKIIGTYKINDFAGCANFGTVGTDTSGVLPVVNRLQIGNGILASYMNGTIKKLSYYPKRLSNTELQALTTV